MTLFSLLKQRLKKDLLVVVGRLIHARQLVNGSIDLGGDRQKGVEIVLNSCTSPFRTIAENAGLKPDVLLDRFESSPQDVLTTTGYDVINEEFGDLVEKGIIDPTKVTRTGLKRQFRLQDTTYY